MGVTALRLNTSLRIICAFVLLIAATISATGQKASRHPQLAAAESAIRRKDFINAVEMLEPLLRAQPRLDAEAYVMLALSKSNLEQPSEAIEVCTRGADAFPGSDSLAEFYVALLRVNTIDQQLRANTIDQHTIKVRLERIMQQPTASAVYVKALSQILLTTNPLDARMETLLTRAVRARPRDVEARYLYGQWACLINKEKLCIEQLTKTLALSGTNHLARVQSYTLIGMAESSSGNRLRAESAFHNALRLNRKLPRPEPQGTFQYAKFLIETARAQQGQTLLDEVLRQAPDFGPARFERARLLAKQGQREAAIDESKRA
ncbi:MAG: tetratricopeptide repeat protein, partial [Acidobacteriota bacterium]|nr:tetratricopeptide repeat protein [Acidobacteriota bacterium]